MADPKLKEWCAEARKLLNKVKGDAHGKAIKSLPDYLTSLESQDPGAYGQYKAEFEKVLQRMRVLDPKADKTALQAEGDRLVELKRRVRTSVKLETCATALSNLMPSDHPSVVLLEQKLDGAQKLLGSGDRAGAELSVATFEQDVKNAQQRIEESRERVVENSKAYPNALQKRTAIEALLKKLRGFYGGHQDTELALDKALKDTEAAASRGQWVEVWTRLKDVRLPTEDECRNVSQGLFDTESLNNPHIATLNRAMTTLNQALNISEFAPYAASTREVLNPYYAATGTARDKLAADIKAQADKLTQVMTTVGGLQTTLPKLLLKVKVASTFVETNGPKLSTELMALSARATQFETALDTKRLFAAKDLAENLLEDAVALRADVEKDMQSYAQACADLIVLETLATKLLTDAKIPDGGALKKDIAAAAALVDAGGLAREKERTRDWVVLKSRVDRGRQALEELDNRVLAYKAFEAERTRADEELKSLFNDADSAIAKLEVAYRTAGLDGAAASTLFRSERLAADKAWKLRIASAATASQLDLEGAKNVLNALVKRAEEGATTQGVEDRKAVLAKAAASADFDLEWKAMALTLDALGALDLDASAPFLAEAEKVRAAAVVQGSEAGWKDALAALKREHGKVRTKSTELNDALTRQRLAVKTEFDALTVALGKLTPALRKRFAELVKALQTDANELREMGNGTNAQAAKLAIDDLKGLTTRVNQLATTPPVSAPVIPTVADLVKGGMTEAQANAEREKQLKSEQSAATLGTVARDLDAFKRRLAEASKSFGKDHAAGVKLLQQALKTLEGQVQGMQPAAATAELQQLNESLDTAQALVKTLQADRLTVANLLKELGVQVAQLKESGRYLKYVGSVATQLKEMIGQQKSAKEPAAMSALLRRAERLKKEVIDARAVPEGAGLEKKQDEIEQKAQAESRLEGEWKGHYPSNSAWEERHLSTAIAAIARHHGDADQIKEIRNMVKKAVKLRNDGDMAGALRQIKLAEIRCQQVVADPMGPALGSRKALVANASQYAADARELVMLILALPDRAAERISLEKPVANALKALVGRAADIVAPEALTAYAMQLDAADLEPARLRELREQAMAQTRALRDVLTNHPLMQRLATTPLNRAVPNVMRRVLQHVNRFEANVSRAVK